MSEVDALFRLLTDAPPRSAEIVKRVALGGMGFPELGKLYGVDVPQAQVLVFRAFLDVLSGGTIRVPDASEEREVLAMLNPVRPERGIPGPQVPEPSLAGTQGERVRRVWDQLSAHKEELEQRLAKAAQDFATSPDRGRDEWLRRIAIVLVLALTAFFYVREQNKPHPPPQKRPVVVPVTPP